MPLLLVLWGTGLLSLIAVSLLSASTTSQRLAHNAIELAQIDALADAAVVRTVAGLSDTRVDARWHADGRTERFDLRGIQVNVRIQDELGRIDPNYADRSVLFGLVRSVGVNVELSNRIVDAILESRGGSSARPADANSGKHNRQPSDSARLRRGLFQSIDELLLVSGMTPEIYRRIAPALTVHSQRQAVDPQLAPREVLLALPAMTPERALQILAERRGGQVQLLDSSGIVPSLRGRAFAMRIDIDRPSVKHSYEAAIRLTDDPNNPYQRLDWKNRATIFPENIR